MRDPLWLNKIDVSSYSTLTDDLVADVCIVGAGMTGITLAYLLRESSLNIVLIDSDQVLHGTTAYTTAKVTAQHDLVYDYLIHHFGDYHAKCYANAQQDAIAFISQTIDSLHIDCDFRRCFSCVYTQDEQYVPLFEKEYVACQKLGLPASLSDHLDLPFPIVKSLVFDHQASFHPLKYLTALLNELKKYSNIHIYEQTPAIDIQEQADGDYLVVTANQATVKAKQIVQASHFPFYDDFALLFAKVEANTSYLSAYQGVDKMPEGMYISYEQPTRTIRTYQDLLIVGGESHRTACSEQTLDHYEAIRDFAKSQFGECDVLFEWSTEDYNTVDRVPFIGRLKEDKDIFVATGYQKWGMTNSTVAALLLSDLLLKRENAWEPLFNPNRVNLKAQLKNLLLYNGQVAFELFKGKLSPAVDVEHLQRKEAMVIETTEGKYGVYKDEENELFIVDITCPHLGCELKFNEAETTWDCPCHGSRFSYKGEILTGPAHLPLNKHKNKIDPNLF